MWDIVSCITLNLRHAEIQTYERNFYRCGRSKVVQNVDLLPSRKKSCSCITRLISLKNWLSLKALSTYISVQLDTNDDTFTQKFTFLTIANYPHSDEVQKKSRKDQTEVLLVHFRCLNRRGLQIKPRTKGE
jgi:hypothetical protein